MSPDGCDGERSFTLASAASSARRESHRRRHHRIRTGHRHRWFRTTTTAGPRRLPPVQSPTLRPKRAHTRSLLRSLALAPHPFHPLRIGLPRHGRGRRMRLARGPLHPPFSVRRDPLRRCVYPTSATDPRHEHSSDRLILESPPPAAFAGATASAAAGPAEAVSETRSSGARLTTSHQLRFRRDTASRSPEQPCPASDLWAPIKDPPKRRFPFSGGVFDRAAGPRLHL
jgi:hypothetical protein